MRPSGETATSKTEAFLTETTVRWAREGSDHSTTVVAPETRIASAAETPVPVAPRFEAEDGACAFDPHAVKTRMKRVARTVLVTICFLTYATPRAGDRWHDVHCALRRRALSCGLGSSG